MQLPSTSRLTALLTFALGGLLPALFLPWGYPAAWLLAGMLLAVLTARLQPLPPGNGDAVQRAPRVLVLCFAAYLLSFLLTTLWHGGSLRELDKAIRYGLGIVLVLALARTRLDAALMRKLVVLAALAALGYAVYDRTVNHAARAGGFMNEIQFGVLAAQVAMINAILAMDAWVANRRQAAVFCGAAVAGLAATLLSGALTALVSLAALPIAMLATQWRRPSLRSVLTVALVLTVVVGALVQTRSQLWQRGVYAVEEVVEYQHFKSGAITYSSNGARIENFHNAWGLFKSAPLMGVGSQGYLQLRKEQVRRGELTAYSGSLGVAHNEFLDAMAKRGLVGLAGLLALLLGPAWMYRRLCDRGPPEGRPWAFAGLAVCIGLMLASLTQNVLTHSTGANYLVMMSAVLLALALRPGPVNGAASAVP